MQDNLTIKTFNTPEQVAQAALELITITASNAIAERGRFVIALAGGSTPQRLYRLLASSEQDWNNWFLIYGDERYLPENDPNRNSYMVNECWANKVKLPTENHFIVDTSAGATAAAADYAIRIQRLLPIDLALLGMGEDGHTASLFPQQIQKNLRCTTSVIAIDDAPKPPNQRISLSYQTFNQSATVCFLITGANKRAVMQQWLNGNDLPVSHIAGVKQTCCLTDIIIAGT